MRIVFLNKILALLISGLLLLPTFPQRVLACSGIDSTSTAADMSQALSPAVVMAAGYLKPATAAAREYRLFAASKHSRDSLFFWLGAAVHLAFFVAILVAVHAHPALLLAGLIPKKPSEPHHWPAVYPPYTGVWIDEFVVTDKNLLTPIAVTTVISPYVVVAIYDPVIHVGALAHFSDDHGHMKASMRNIFSALEEMGSDLSKLRIHLMLDSHFKPKTSEIETFAKAFREEFKQRRIPPPTIQMDSAPSYSYVRLNTVEGSIDFLPPRQPDVFTDFGSAVDMAIMMNMRRKGFATDVPREPLYRLPTPPHIIDRSDEKTSLLQNVVTEHRLNDQTPPPPTNNEIMTIEDFPISDPLAIAQLIREINIILAEIQYQMSTIDDQSDHKNPSRETQEAFQAMYDSLAKGLPNFPEAVLTARNGLNHLVGLHLLKRPSEYLAKPYFTNALLGTDVVAVSSQGRGIATALTVRALQWAKEHKFDHYLALIDKLNERGLRHFSKAVRLAGFVSETVAETKHHITFAVHLKNTDIAPNQLSERAA